MLDPLCLLCHLPFSSLMYMHLPGFSQPRLLQLPVCLCISGWGNSMVDLPSRKGLFFGPSASQGPTMLPHLLSSCTPTSHFHFTGVALHVPLLPRHSAQLQLSSALWQLLPRGHSSSLTFLVFQSNFVWSLCWFLGTMTHLCMRWVLLKSHIHTRSSPKSETVLMILDSSINLYCFPGKDQRPQACTPHRTSISPTLPPQRKLLENVVSPLETVFNPHFPVFLCIKLDWEGSMPGRHHFCCSTVWRIWLPCSI